MNTEEQETLAELNASIEADPAAPYTARLLRERDAMVAKLKGRELQEKRLLLAEINLALDARRNDVEVLQAEKRRLLVEINLLVIDGHRYDTEEES